MSRCPRLGFARATALAVALVVTTGVVPAQSSTPATGSAAAIFRVGAAVIGIDPHVDVYAGGADPSPPLRRTHDPLQVRAIYVSNGQHAVAVAVVDAQAEFAAVQDGQDLGVSATRERAAQALSSTTGLRMGAADLVVQSTHSHAAPTLEGIWGPVPTSYLRQVQDATVRALVEAAKAARPARLQVATTDVRSLAAVDVEQNSFPGWMLDAQLTVLRAVSPGDGRTLATWASVPLHDATVLGANTRLLSADFYGVVRDRLDRSLGGVSVVGPATLGRMQAPVENFTSAAGYPVMEWYGAAVANAATTALRSARWLTSSTVASSETMSRVPATTPLLGLVAAYRLPPAQRQQIFEKTGLYPINRSTSPPSMTGNVLGTPLTALRIGNTAWVSMPGEPFPEIRHSIVRATHGADVVTVLSKGQDDLGYFYSAENYPFGFVYPTDTSLFNVAPQAGNQFIVDGLGNVGALGFRTDPPLPLLGDNDYGQATRPGLQVLASPADTDAAPSGQADVVLQSVFSPAVFAGARLAGPVRVAWGDGSGGTMRHLERDSTQGGPSGGTGAPALVHHRYRPGRYVVSVTGVTEDGKAARAQTVVVVHPPLRVEVRRDGGGPSVHVSGGDGHVAAVRWVGDDGRVSFGLTGPRRGHGTVRVTDLTGTTATAAY